MKKPIKIVIIIIAILVIVIAGVWGYLEFEKQRQINLTKETVSNLIEKLENNNYIDLSSCASSSYYDETVGTRVSEEFTAQSYLNKKDKIVNQAVSLKKDGVEEKYMYITKNTGNILDTYKAPFIRSSKNTYYLDKYTKNSIDLSLETNASIEAPNVDFYIEMLKNIKESTYENKILVDKKYAQKLIDVYGNSKIQLTEDCLFVITYDEEDNTTNLELFNNGYEVDGKNVWFNFNIYFNKAINSFDGEDENDFDYTIPSNDMIKIQNEN